MWKSSINTAFADVFALLSLCFKRTTETGGGEGQGGREGASILTHRKDVSVHGLKKIKCHLVTLTRQRLKHACSHFPTLKPLKR